MATKSPVDRLYEQAKATGMDRLGGERAYWIAGPSIRRMAVEGTILTTLALQDDEQVSDRTVRTMLAGLFDRLTGDADFQG